MKWTSRDLVLLFILVVPSAQGASAAVSADQKDSLDTVVVEGSRSQLDLIRHEMVRVEDKFYERYNELNTNHDFDTHCYIEARVSTRTKRRYCRAVYQEKALEREGQDHAEAMKVMINGLGPKTDDGGGGPAPWAPPPPATIVIEARRKDYQNNIRDVVKRNPELIEMLRERYELGQRYETTRRKVWGLKPSPAEDQPAPAVSAPP
jgi:hypothetical protein